jgi:hypothetical protein
MNIQNILADLKAQRDRIDRAIAALEGMGGRGPGRPAGKTAAAPARRGRRHMSAAARKRISEMMKLRWAERKRKSR